MPGSFRQLRSGRSGLQVLVPFTRLWAVDRFFAAMYASDLPCREAELIAYVDSDDPALVEAVTARAEAGPWAAIALQVSGWPPPGEYARSTDRRPRHTVMRQALRGLVRPEGMVFATEDDTLLPADVYARLSALDGDYRVGAQVGRWSTRCVGLWRIRCRSGKPHEVVSVASGGTVQVDACGLYAMLCTAEDYLALDFSRWHQALGHDVSVMWEATRAGKRIVADLGVDCGHMMQDGRVYWLKDAVPYVNGLPRRACMERMMTPAGPFFAGLTEAGAEPVEEEVAPMQRGEYRVKERVFVAGRLWAGRHKQVPLEDAVRVYAEGWFPYTDPELAMLAAKTKPVAYETKPAMPVAEDKPDAKGLWACKHCGKRHRTLERVMACGGRQG